MSYKDQRTGIRARQIKAALAQMDRRELADRSSVSIPALKRMEAGDWFAGTYENVAAIVVVLESAGVKISGQ